MRKIEVIIRQLVWAFMQSFKPTSYDIVIYKGKRYYIKYNFSSENIWNLFDLNDHSLVKAHVKGSDLKIVQSLKRFVNVFKTHLTFQKQNWGSIDYCNPVGTRLSYNNSDDIYFHKRF